MIFTRFGVSWRYLKKGPAAASSLQVSYAAVAGKPPQRLFGTCVNNVLSAKRPGLKAQDAYMPYPGLKAFQLPTSTSSGVLARNLDYFQIRREGRVCSSQAAKIGVLRAFW